ncbi:protein of unknown function [Methylocaldum szegediense]|uniref:Uncharacterized protein n=1 Tax=Methylocaldum szegediense TaxID=73780 RepID=A0ABM9I2M4_9GAMM|nr:protein of unknown function [Methylocaldum szegediense]
MRIKGEFVLGYGVALAALLRQAASLPRALPTQTAASGSFALYVAIMGKVR